MWEDIVKDWEKIPTEAYQFLFSQAKDRYEETMSESESITNKTINLTTITIVSLSGFVSYKFTSNPNIIFTIILLLAFIVDLFFLCKLLFPKSIIQRGSPPKETFINYLDNGELKENEKIRLVYYHELIRYQERTEIMDRMNRYRLWIYGIALCLTIACTVTTGCIILSTIYHP